MEAAHDPDPSAESASGRSRSPGLNPVPPTFAVTNYQVRGNTRIATNVLESILSKHTGTNLTEQAVVKALAKRPEDRFDGAADFARALGCDLGAPTGRG